MTSFTVISPATQQPLFDIPCLSHSEIDKVVDKATDAFRSWQKVPVTDRVQMLQQFCQLFKQKQEQVAESLASQMGRPKRYGVGEINGVLERAGYVLSVAEECLKDEVIEDQPHVKRYLRKEPLGPIFIIAAWNYPYLTAVNNVIPALLAGNPVLLKQSPQTPKCADIFVQTLHEAGVPREVVQVVHVDDDGAAYLAQHPKVKYVSFTGSVAVGKKIRQAIGDSHRLIGLGMELGGKDPAYVLPDADIDYAAENIVDGAFFNSGQCCCSIERCYVHESVYDAFVKKAVAVTENYVLGDPNDEKTTLGPMANLRFANNVRAHVKDAVEKGAKCLIDTQKYFPKDKENTTYVAPQILVNVTHDMTVMQEETFGPVLGIMKVSSDEEAIRLMNDSSYGLTASIWTSSPEKAVAIGDQIDCGTWFMNRCDYVDPALAWVGAKDSGLGFSLSKQCFSQFTSERYPMCSQLITENSIPEFDNLYLDMNGIIHNCSHNNSDDAHFRITEEQIWLAIFNYVDHLFTKIKPKKLFFLAIDGVAPRAKMNQQRSRRFRTAKDAEDARQRAIQKGEELPDEDPFDSNCITPGTEFMRKLTLQLRYFISKKVSEDSNWRNVEIVLSGPEVPGEGEHKIMEYIRLAKAQPDYNNNIRHCLYGLDADLVMLGLLSHDPHFALLREEVNFGRQRSKRKTGVDNQNFYLMHLSLLREYLDLEFHSLEQSLSFKYDLERVLDDFILLALFVGNDFLPHLPNVHIHEGALGLMFGIYKQVLPTCSGYIQDGGRVDMERLQKILDALADSVEHDAYEAEHANLLYLAGKREEGQTERELLHELEKKKRSRQVMTTSQQQLFFQVREFVLEHQPGKAESYHFPPNIKARDRKFIEELARKLGLMYATEYSNEDGTKHVYIEFYENETEDDDEEVSEDEEAIAARDRVLKKYESAEIISDTQTEEELDRIEKEKYEKGLKEWKAYYYKEKMDIDIDNPQQMEELIGSYMIGIQWVLRYYYNGVASWGWFYPYYYAPKISDLKNIVRFQDHPFQLGQPFKPFEQLMGVLPSLSKKLLPPAYQELMVDPSSPIIDFYPRDFDIDMNGKKQEWEAVVKIPFIDETRLLQAMKEREHRLTDAQRAMTRFGESYKFVYDAKMGSETPEKATIYPSPLPGVFPDIHHCMAREELFHLPTLEGGLSFKKGLLDGAKIGKDALAGFPSLQTIPHHGELKFHGVNVFQQDSRNETMVVTLENAFASSDIQNIAKLLLYKRVFVHYPYLQEAVVIGVSSVDAKYYMKFMGKKRQIRESLHSEEDATSWRNRIGRVEYLASKRFGLDIGKTEVGLHVCVLRGMKRTENGALVKEYVNPAEDELIPVQMCVLRVNNEDPRYKEQPPPPIEEEYPIGSQVFFLDNMYYGALATVVGHSSKQTVDIQMVVPRNDKDAVEPTFGHQVAMQQNEVVTYLPSFAVSQQLKLSPLVLSKITSSLLILDKNTQRVNVGLSLKFEGKQQKVLGYTRKSSAGHWEYSAKAIQLITEYMQAFPKFIDMVSGQKGGAMLHVQDLVWSENGPKELQKMKAWLKEKKVDDLPRAGLEVEEMEAPFVKLLEDLSSQYIEKYDQVEFKKVVIRRIPRNVLMRPAEAETRLGGQEFRLGDRIVYALDSGAVPFAAKGTVVGVQEKVVDVVMDTPFMAGKDLDGRCSGYRGISLPYANVINLSAAMVGPKQAPPANKPSNHGARNGHDHGSRGGPKTRGYTKQYHGDRDRQKPSAASSSQ
ncbi:exoribonuclease 1 [Radiomyces spectabilis]|uniref:exoribonuclease 1 n=1 Tax=Radiomyces spectabilis TaxID=64574 RepID=UPI00221FD81A|nr:exoribonuclease 1 [Radiomyces spectabilis]KAI8388238.1 exoribonuclease 1 [Radiomyces spectabilis]